MPVPISNRWRKPECLRSRRFRTAGSILIIITPLLTRSTKSSRKSWQKIQQWSRSSRTRWPIQNKLCQDKGGSSSPSSMFSKRARRSRSTLKTRSTSSGAVAFVKDWRVSLETVSALAQLVAAIGVIASLFYLGAQIRQNTRSQRSVVVDSLTQSLIAVLLGPQAADPAITRACAAAVEDWRGATEEDRLRAAAVLLALF